MEENTLLEISNKFKSLLIDNGIFSSDRINHSQTNALNLYNINNRTPSISLLGVNFSNYSKLAEILILSDINEKAIVGKKKEENSNAILSVNNIDKVYSKKAITSISRRLLLPEELLNKPIKDVFSPNLTTTIELIKYLESLEESNKILNNNEIRKKIRSDLFSKLQKASDDNQKALNLYYRGNDNEPFEVKFINNQGKILLNEKQINNFNSIKKEDLKLFQTDNTYEKNLFNSYYSTVEKAIVINSRINLQAMCNGFLGPFFSSERTTHRYNPYQEFKFKIMDLKNLDPIFDDILINSNENEYISINELAEKLADEDEVKIEDNNDSNTDEINNSIIENIKEYNVSNKIFFGPPGTGKSFKMKNEAKSIGIDNEEQIIRITFHPEYSYYDFIGQYKPVVGYELVSNKIINFSGQELNENLLFKKPITYYDFIPGPFTKSIVKALNLLDKRKNVLLIIEEINRGNCAAIFGDIFQLLDRFSNIKKENYGYSEYSIDITDEMKNYIRNNVDNKEIFESFFKNGFRLPKNLFIYSTMNTSDQSLFPMDSAFKRRWSMQYIGIDYDVENLKNVCLPKPYQNINWLDFIKICNREIVLFTESDDKQIGQWFLEAEEDEISESEFVGKVLSYLWFDVFRHEPSRFFKDEIKTYDNIISNYNKGVIKDEIKKAMEESNESSRI